jgi:hypothetical protein
MFLDLPDPNPNTDPDPSIIQKKIVRKTFLHLPSFLSMKTDVNVASKSKKQKNFFLNLFFVDIWKLPS